MTRAKLISEVPVTRNGCQCIPACHPNASVRPARSAGFNPRLHRSLEEVAPTLAGLRSVPDPDPAERTWDDDCEAAKQGPDEYANWIADLQDAS